MVLGGVYSLWHSNVYCSNLSKEKAVLIAVLPRRKASILVSIFIYSVLQAKINLCLSNCYQRLVFFQQLISICFVT